MPTELVSGNASFSIDVSYKLIDIGPQTDKPLFIYLHGYKQNLQYFEKKCSDLLSLEAHHLFIQGPYPIYDEARRRKIEQWGRAWYLYDGEQEQFLKSMEKSSGFIQTVAGKLMQEISVNRVSVIGYSMGGYLAGYFALSRPHFVNDLIVMGGRIKTESFQGQSYNGMNVLHLHGIDDDAVSAERAKMSCDDLKSMGASVTYKRLGTTHKLTSTYIQALKDWLIKQKITKLD